MICAASNVRQSQYCARIYKQRHTELFVPRPWTLGAWPLLQHEHDRQRDHSRLSFDNVTMTRRWRRSVPWPALYALGPPWQRLGFPYNLNNRYDCSHPHHKEAYPRSVIKTYDQPNIRKHDDSGRRNRDVHMRLDTSDILHGQGAPRCFGILGMAATH